MGHLTDDAVIVNHYQRESLLLAIMNDLAEPWDVDRKPMESHEKGISIPVRVFRGTTDIFV